MNTPSLSSIKNKVSALYTSVEETMKKLFENLHICKKQAHIPLTREKHETIPSSAWEEVYSGSSLNGFRKPGVHFQLSIERKNILLGREKKLCHIVRQSHGERKFTLFSPEGKPLYDGYFHDYKLTRETTPNKTTIVKIFIQREKNQAFQELPW